jgi:phosphoribosylanthranilate isomerase
LQLHGKETPERVAVIRSLFRLPVIKALPISQRADLSSVQLYAKVTDMLMFDARAPRAASRPGGHGQAFDWHLLENLAMPVPFMLSGGLDAGNVADALRITRPDGLDVSSGVEHAPGEKDAGMIRAFIRTARDADAKMPPRAESRRPRAV